MEACVDRITVYLAQNESVGVNYSADAVKPELHAYSDSDWQVTHSTTGFAVMLAGAAVSYSSKRQQSIALSSTEAEIMAASQCACEVMFIRNLYGEMGGDISKPTVIYVDNSGAVQLARDRRSCQRSRHIQRRFLKLREWQAEGHIKLVYVSTDDNAADVLTKPLPTAAFRKHTDTLTGA
jgi:hypothetical protein